MIIGENLLETKRKTKPTDAERKRGAGGKGVENRSSADRHHRATNRAPRGASAQVVQVCSRRVRSKGRKKTKRKAKKQKRKINDVAQRRSAGATGMRDERVRVRESELPLRLVLSRDFDKNAVNIILITINYSYCKRLY